MEQLGGKQLVMQYMMHTDPNVKYEALIAVQKLMVHNWSVHSIRMTPIDLVVEFVRVIVRNLSSFLDSSPFSSLNVI